MKKNKFSFRKLLFSDLKIILDQSPKIQIWKLNVSNRSIRSLEFSLIVFLELAEFSDKNVCHHSKRVQTCHLLYYRWGCYHSASKTHVRDKIFNLTPIHASVIYQIPWIQWISVPLRDNSMASEATSTRIPLNLSTTPFRRYMWVHCYRFTTYDQIKNR